jgi:apolipoprotein N-acyltransferase
LTHGAAMTLAAPPFDLWPLVFVSLLPLAWLLGRPTQRPWRDALLVAIGTLPMWCYWQVWTAEVTTLGYVPFVCLQASYAGLFVLLAGRLQRRLPRVPLSILVPLLWTAIEFFRGELFLDGYAWGLLAHPLIAVTALASPAALLGTYFVSFLVAAVNGAIADLLITPRRTIAGACALGAAAIAWLIGAIALPTLDPAAPKIQPLILQTNVAQDNKVSWSLEREIKDWNRFQELIASGTHYFEPEKPKPDLVIWPETMMPGPTLEPAALETLYKAQIILRGTGSIEGKIIPATKFADELREVQSRIGVPMLVGEEGVDNLRVVKGENNSIELVQDRTFNSVYLLEGGEIQPIRYDKVRLTPFGETMPYIRYWPWLQQQMLNFGAHGMKFNLSEGTRYTVFNVSAASIKQDVRIVTPICFEITIASTCRRLVFDHGKRRADLIASVTNDGWFGNSDVAHLQHLQIARWRCVELATPMARAANTGISALVDAHGRIVSRGVNGDPRGLRVDGTLSGALPLGTATTFYARIGDVFAWSALGFTLAALIGSLVRRGTPPNAQQAKI